MPIENRTNMLSTGIKTPVGHQDHGAGPAGALATWPSRPSTIVLTVPGTTSAYPERTFGGYYLDIDVDREQAARYGLTTGDVQDVISTAMGGMKITTAVEGLERYPINIRYARDLRDDPLSIKQVLVPTPTGAQIPLGAAGRREDQPRPADDQERERPPRPPGCIVDVAGRDIGGYIADAQKAIAAAACSFPPGTRWSGRGSSRRSRRPTPG